MPTPCGFGLNAAVQRCLAWPVHGADSGTERLQEWGGSDMASCCSVRGTLPEAVVLTGAAP